MAAREHFVYRAYDASGVLLYVGMTLNPSNRFAWHRSISPWFSQMASVRMTGPLTKRGAMELERTLIRHANPLHNKARLPVSRLAHEKWLPILTAELARRPIEEAAA